MLVRIELTYKTPKGTKTTFTSEDMQAKKALLLAEDLGRTGRLDSINFSDRHNNSWNLKELKKQLEEIQTEPHNVTVYFDGGFDLKTRKAGLGCAIYYEQNHKQYRLRKNARVDELESNNEAEYAALNLALNELELLGVHHMPVTFIGDSQVVINQMEEEWPVYEEVLNRWADRTEAAMKALGIAPEFELISRKQNREADQLATQALREVEVTSTIEVK